MSMSYTPVGSSSSSFEGGDQQPRPAVRHPVAAFFHIFFKASAMFIFQFGTTLITDSFVLVFIICVLLLACDFWTVKNITGRLLVGLRWWNEVREDGTTVWIYEAKPDSRQVDPSDSFVFWTGLLAAPVVWLVLGLINGLKFQWWLIVATALVLSCANVVGYFYCKKDAGTNIRNFITQRVMSAAVSSATQSSSSASSTGFANTSV